MSSADVVICGAGMAGAAAAYHLAVRHGVRDMALVDEREPLTLTSDKGTQAYRNWWPGPGDGGFWCSDSSGGKCWRHPCVAGILRDVRHPGHPWPHVLRRRGARG